MEDFQIIDLYFARDESAIDETDKKYGRLLYKIAANILKSLEDREEVVNDTYMGAWNSMPPTRPAALRHFLSRITRNLCLNRLDYKKAKKRSQYGETLLSELEDCVPDSSSSPEKIWEDREIGQVISDFLSRQDRLKTAVFLRRYFYGERIGEISRFFGISERKVKYTLYSMREKLRLELISKGVTL